MNDIYVSSARARVAEELKGAAEAGRKVSEHLRSATEKRENPGKYTSSD